MLYNGSEIVLTVFACAKLGAVFNPLNYRLPAGDVEYILNDVEVSLLLFEEATRQAVERARSDLDTVAEFVSIDEKARSTRGTHAPYPTTTIRYA